MILMFNDRRRGGCGCNLQWMGLTLLLMLSVMQVSVAADFPTRPVRLVVHIGAGSSMDIIGRVLAQKMTDFWGYPVIVDNRAGAGGMLGIDVVAKAPADGQTILFASSSMGIGASYYKKLPFDPLHDFAPITQLTSRYNALVVPSTSAVNGLMELIHLAKSKPGQVSFGSGGGTGSSDHMAGELLGLMSGVKLLHVPYKSGPQAIGDLMASQLTFYIGGIPVSLSMIKSGKLKPLGVSSLKRIAQLPEVPTMAESGVAGYEVNVWYGLLAPVATASSTVEKIARDVSHIIKSPQMKSRLLELGVEAEGSSPDEFGRYFRADIAKWAKVVRVAKLSAE